MKFFLDLLFLLLTTREMTRFVLIVLLIITVVWLVATYTSRKVDKFVKRFSVNPSKKDDSKEEVLYKKDDIVVLKGEADDKSK